MKSGASQRHSFRSIRATGAAESTSSEDAPWRRETYICRLLRVQSSYSKRQAFSSDPFDKTGQGSVKGNRYS
uniref:SFRICE_003395 n=1 Tax=Spodoptera frugiperda TaxID=7108 RepID=A0A2H1W299_SPOFR